jgi:hypothetical protein
MFVAPVFALLLLAAAASQDQQCTAESCSTPETAHALLQTKKESPAAGKVETGETPVEKVDMKAAAQAGSEMSAEGSAVSAAQKATEDSGKTRDGMLEQLKQIKEFQQNEKAGKEKTAMAVEAVKINLSAEELESGSKAVVEGKVSELAAKKELAISKGDDVEAEKLKEQMDKLEGDMKASEEASAASSAAAEAETTKEAETTTTEAATTTTTTEAASEEEGTTVAPEEAAEEPTEEPGNSTEPAEGAESNCHTAVPSLAILAAVQHLLALA